MESCNDDDKDTYSRKLEGFSKILQKIRIKTKEKFALTDDEILFLYGEDFFENNLELSNIIAKRDTYKDYLRYQSLLKRGKTKKIFRFPLTFYDNLDLSLFEKISVDEIMLPFTIYGNLDITGLKTVDNLRLPDKIKELRIRVNPQINSIMVEDFPI